MSISPKTPAPAAKTVQVACNTAAAVDQLRAEVRARVTPAAADIVAILGALNGAKSCTITMPNKTGSGYNETSTGWSVEVTW